mgnify:CR=1 FL=1
MPGANQLGAAETTAVVVAAGLGSRILPLSHEVPKCMLEVQNQSMLHRALATFNDLNITKIVVVGGYKSDIGEIRGRAEEEAGGYKLGEDLFDVAPFSEERRGLIEEREGTLGADVRGAIGPDPLFDVSGALRAGGRAQGVVSGRGQNQALLDQIAARELGSLSGRNRRSLGSRGSGAF